MNDMGKNFFKPISYSLGNNFKENIAQTNRPKIFWGIRISDFGNQNNKYLVYAFRR